MAEKYSSEKDTKEHIAKVNDFADIFIEKLKEKSDVSKWLDLFIAKLRAQVVKHDQSKLEAKEKDIFDEYTPKLKGSTYGSDEYKSFLKNMKPALDHHYAKNRHHPEHFEDGIYGMNLIDLIEFFVDNLAATKRHDDGNIFKSIIFNADRFKFSNDLSNILWNTAKEVFDENQSIDKPKEMSKVDKKLTLVDLVEFIINIIITSRENSESVFEVLQQKITKNENLKEVEPILTNTLKEIFRFLSV